MEFGSPFVFHDGPSNLFGLIDHSGSYFWVIVTKESYLGLKYNLLSSIPSAKKERLSNKSDAAVPRT